MGKLYDGSSKRKALDKFQDRILRHVASLSTRECTISGVGRCILKLMKPRTTAQVWTVRSVEDIARSALPIGQDENRLPLAIMETIVEAYMGGLHKQLRSPGLDLRQRLKKLRMQKHERPTDYVNRFKSELSKWPEHGVSTHHINIDFVKGLLSGIANSTKVSSMNLQVASLDDLATAATEAWDRQRLLRSGLDSSDDDDDSSSDSSSSDSGSDSSNDSDDSTSSSDDNRKRRKKSSKRRGRRTRRNKHGSSRAPTPKPRRDSSREKHVHFANPVATVGMNSSQQQVQLPAVPVAAPTWQSLQYQYDQNGQPVYMMQPPFGMQQWNPQPAPMQQNGYTQQPTRNDMDRQNRLQRQGNRFNNRNNFDNTQLLRALVTAVSQTNRPRSGRPPVCYWCGETGHMQDMCEKKKRGEPKTYFSNRSNQSYNTAGNGSMQQSQQVYNAVPPPATYVTTQPLPASQPMPTPTVTQPSQPTMQNVAGRVNVTHMHTSESQMGEPSARRAAITFQSAGVQPVGSEAVDESMLYSMTAYLAHVADTDRRTEVLLSCIPNTITSDDVDRLWKESEDTCQQTWEVEVQQEHDIQASCTVSGTTVQQQDSTTTKHVVAPTVNGRVEAVSFIPNPNAYKNTSNLGAVGQRPAEPPARTMLNRMMHMLQQAAKTLTYQDTAVQTEIDATSTICATQHIRTNSCILPTDTALIYEPTTLDVTQDAAFWSEVHAASRTPLQRAADQITDPVTGQIVQHMASKSVGLCYHEPGTVAVVALKSDGNAQVAYPNRIMRDLGANTNVMSLGCANKLGLQVDATDATVVTSSGKAEKVVGVLADKLCLVLAPKSPHRVAINMGRVYVMKGLEPLCDLLVGTPVDRDVAGYTDVAKCGYYFPVGICKGDFTQYMRLNMKCSDSKMVANQDSVLLALTTFSCADTQDATHANKLVADCSFPEGWRPDGWDDILTELGCDEEGNALQPWTTVGKRKASTLDDNSKSAPCKKPVAGNTQVKPAKDTCQAAASSAHAVKNVQGTTKVSAASTNGQAKPSGAPLVTTGAVINSSKGTQKVAGVAQSTSKAAKPSGNNIQDKARQGYSTATKEPTPLSRAEDARRNAQALDNKRGPSTTNQPAVTQVKQERPNAVGITNIAAGGRSVVSGPATSTPSTRPMTQDKSASRQQGAKNVTVSAQSSAHTSAVGAKPTQAVTTPSAKPKQQPAPVQSGKNPMSTKLHNADALNGAIQLPGSQAAATNKHAGGNAALATSITSETTVRQVGSYAATKCNAQMAAGAVRLRSDEPGTGKMQQAQPHDTPSEPAVRSSPPPAALGVRSTTSMKVTATVPGKGLQLAFQKQGVLKAPDTTPVNSVNTSQTVAAETSRQHPRVQPPAGGWGQVTDDPLWSTYSKRQKKNKKKQAKQLELQAAAGHSNTSTLADSSYERSGQKPTRTNEVLAQVSGAVCSEEVCVPELSQMMGSTVCTNYDVCATFSSTGSYGNHDKWYTISMSWDNTKYDRGSTCSLQYKQETKPLILCSNMERCMDAVPFVFDGKQYLTDLGLIFDHKGPVRTSTGQGRCSEAMPNIYVKRLLHHPVDLLSCSETYPFSSIMSDEDTRCEWHEVVDNSCDIIMSRAVAPACARDTSALVKYRKVGWPFATSLPPPCYIQSHWTGLENQYNVVRDTASERLFWVLPHFMRLTDGRWQVTIMHTEENSGVSVPQHISYAFPPPWAVAEVKHEHYLIAFRKYQSTLHLALPKDVEELMLQPTHVTSAQTTMLQAVQATGQHTLQPAQFRTPPKPVSIPTVNGGRSMEPCTGQYAKQQPTTSRRALSPRSVAVREILQLANPKQVVSPMDMSVHHDSMYGASYMSKHKDTPPHLKPPEGRIVRQYEQGWVRYELPDRTHVYYNEVVHITQTNKPFMLLPQTEYQSCNITILTSGIYVHERNVTIKDRANGILVEHPQLQDEQWTALPPHLGYRVTCRRQAMDLKKLVVRSDMELYTQVMGATTTVPQVSGWKPKGYNASLTCHTPRKMPKVRSGGMSPEKLRVKKSAMNSATLKPKITVKGMTQFMLFMLLLPCLGYLAMDPTCKVQDNRRARNIHTLHNTCSPKPPRATAPVKCSSHARMRGTRTPPQRRPTPCRPVVATSITSTFEPGGVQRVLPTSEYEKDKDGGWIWGNHPLMTQEELELMKQVVRERRHCFAYSVNELPGYCGDIPPFTIVTKSNEPVFEKPRNYSKAEREVMDEKCQQLLEAGIIKECKFTTYAACPTMPMKKDVNGNWLDRRFCVDWTKLNLLVEQDRYGQRSPDRIFDSLGRCRFYSHIDCRQGYFQLLVSEADQHKTSFWWGLKAFFFLRLPQGMKCSAAYYQRVMDHELARTGCTSFASAWQDDVLIYSETALEHIEHIKRVLETLHEVGLRVHPDKSVFGAAVVEFLGHNVSEYGLSPAEAKIAAIKALKPPTNIGELRSVLGLMNYYRGYVPSFSQLCQPLYQLMKKGVQWSWGEQHQTAFDTLLKELIREGNALKRVDPEKPLILHTDWSRLGMGAVLGQLDDQGRECICACVSRSLNKHEQNYSSYQGEMLAAVWAIKTLRHYLHGQHFTLVTDHQPLKWLMSSKNLTGQYARWALVLQEFDFTVQHRPGDKHQNADALSRNPQQESFDGTGARLDVDSEDAENQGTAAALACSPQHTNISTCLRVAISRAVVNTTRADSVADTYMPSSDQLLQGNSGIPTLDAEQPPDDCSDISAGWSCNLHHRAAVWVSKAMAVKPALPGEQPQNIDKSPNYPVALPPVSTKIVGTEFFRTCHKGIIVCEINSGPCPGLEMILRNGMAVTKYVYCSASPVDQRVARQRMQELCMGYTKQLAPGAVVNALHSLPHQGSMISMDSCVKAGLAEATEPVMLVGTWNTAGGAGIATQDAPFITCMRLLHCLQTIRRGKVTAYIFEHATYGTSTAPNSHFAEAQTRMLGCGVNGSALMQQGPNVVSRLMFTNISNSVELTAVLNSASQDRSIAVSSSTNLSDMLGYSDFNITSANVTKDKYDLVLSKSPDLRLLTFTFAISQALDRWHSLTEPIQTRSAVACVSELQQQHLSCQYGQGYQLVAASGWLPSQPLGIRETGTAQPVTVVWRHSKDKSGLGYGKKVENSAPAHLHVPSGQVNASIEQCEKPEHDEPWAVYNTNVVTSLNEEARDNMRAETGPLEIWYDQPVLMYLSTGQMPAGASEREIRRITRRAAGYTLVDGTLMKRMPDKSSKIVPKPADRAAVVKQTHETCGHFGVKRTLHLVMHGHWWKGMLTEVKQVLASCTACSRVKANFNATTPELQPLEIAGLFYRWGCDLCGPFPITAAGNTYIMICIEYFSKHVEAIPIPNKASETTCRAFLTHVISRFGACAEVVTDGGREFQGDFASLLEQCFIDHRITSPNCPRSDGLSERCVQTVKAALRKLCLAAGSQENWDVELQWLLLGYRCSKQASIGFSPYEMLYAREPTIPPAIVQRLKEPINFDDVDAAVTSLSVRAQVLRKSTIMAGDNHRIAQHRDTLRYAMLRGGGYSPKLRKFEPGDFVYLRQGSNMNTLMPKAKQNIYRVVEVHASGVLVLQGKCGRLLKNNVVNCAPCHLPGIDPTIDPSLARPDAAHACEICNFPDDEALMVLCDGCNAGYHTYCMQPPLATVPDGDWICPHCVADGITIETVKAARTMDGQVESNSDKRTTAGTYERDARAKHLDGRVIVLQENKKGQPAQRWGTLKFVGAHNRPKYYDIHLMDGSVVQAVTYTFAARRVMPEGTKLPVQPVTAVTTSATETKPAKEWPRSWSLTHDAQSTHHVLTTLMPGHWDVEHALQLSRFAPASAMFETEALEAVTDAVCIPSEVRVLFQVLQLSALFGVFDPWCTGPAILETCREFNLHVFSNSRDRRLRVDFCQDPSMPGSYEYVKSQGVCMDMILSSPWAVMLDVALPLAEKFAGSVVAMRAPLPYITAAPLPRKRWLQKLKDAGRLIVIYGLPKSLAGNSNVWIVIFKTVTLRNRLVRPAYNHDDFVIV